MKQWTRYIKLMMPVLLVQALTSCSLIDEPEISGDGNVQASLAFMVSNAEEHPTRMSDDVVQELGSSYRDLEILSMTPFAINGETFANNGRKIVSTDVSTLSLDDTVRVDKTKKTFFLYHSFGMSPGVNAFLVYGRAPVGERSKEENGSLLFSPTDLSNPATLRFRPEAIYTGADTPGEAGLLADYLNHIAGVTGWSSTGDATLKGLFLSFTGLANEENMMLAGSSANVMAHVNALYNKVNVLSYPENSEGALLRAEILNRIKSYAETGLILTVNNDGKLTGLSLNGEAYPALKGLPDGAAALRWVDGVFSPRIATTPQDNINSIGRFCYPAELFYYVNSHIDTSDTFIGEDVYKDTDIDWDAVRSQYAHQPGTVTASTKSVAIHEPLQYGVGRLKITMKATEGALRDSKGYEVVTMTSSTTDVFPLTGVIVCNQHPVDFNFKPVLDNGAASHVDDRFIYDTQVKKNDNTYYCLTTTEQSIPSTLVLQTYDTGEGNDKKGAEKVNFAMEFLNNSGKTFYGKNCVIYPDTKFYLIGKADPLKTASSSASLEAVGRVFTQDHITTISTKVESLANAYNVLPDLIGGRLELGIELVSNWVQAETTNVTLK